MCVCIVPLIYLLFVSVHADCYYEINQCEGYFQSHGHLKLHVCQRSRPYPTRTLLLYPD